MNEEWREVRDHPFYEVSNMGNVRKTLRQTCDPEGYPRVTVDRKRVRVHQLVMEAFSKKRHENDIVDHINGQKNDNRLENLEYVTPKENSIRASRNGQLISGRRKTEIIATNVETGERRCFPSQKQAARVIGCDNSEINKALRNKREICHGYRLMYMRDYQKSEDRDLEWLRSQDNRQLDMFDGGFRYGH